jgi:hypothetical protein
MSKKTSIVCCNLTNSFSCFGFFLLFLSFFYVSLLIFAVLCFSLPIVATLPSRIVFICPSVIPAQKKHGWSRYSQGSAGFCIQGMWITAALTCSSLYCRKWFWELQYVTAAYVNFKPITVTARSKAWTAFSHSEQRHHGFKSHSKHGRLFAFNLFVFFCV